VPEKPQQQPTQVEEPVQQSQPVEAPVIVPEVKSEPPVQLPASTTPQEVPTQSQDNENNNVTNANQISTPQTPVVYAEETAEVKEEVVAQVSAPAAANGQDANDTNNNNYQISTSSSESVKEKEREPQDSNNNSTNEKSTDVPSNIRSSSAEPNLDSSSAATPAVERPTRKISVIDYIGDQWSPDNENGKKYYTRDQLLKLKDQLIASMEPGLHPNVAQIVMKNNKETLNNTLTQTMPPPGMQMPRNAPYDAVGSVAPKFMNQMSRNVYPKRPSQQGGNNKQALPGRGSVQGPILQIKLGVQEDVKLNESENAWKPKHLQRGTDMTEEERETNELLNSFRSMLNKLTAENFNTLVNEVKKYKINTFEKLNGVIGLLFEKAISEPKFAPTYASLCSEVCNVHTLVETSENRQGTNQQNQKSTFKKNLISQCQREFERHKEEALVFNEIEEEMSQIEKLPDSEREEKKALLEEKHFKIRQRANGTVKFIGELYKIDMLTFKIMNQCVNILLEQPTEEKVERVCKLLTTIGMKMERETQGETLNQHFETLAQMLHPNNKIIRSSRIKFEIQNLQDLRRNKWKERRADQIPRTMGEIINEAEREHQMAYQRNMKDDRNRGGNFNNRGGRNQQDSDGWNNVGGGNKQRSTPISLKMIPQMSVISSDTTAKLGNPTNYQNFSFSSNKFSGLATDVEDGPVIGGGSKNSSMERTQNRGYYGNNNGNAPYSGRSSGSNQGSRNSSQNRSRDNSNDIRGGASRSMQGSLPSRNSMNLMDTVKQNKSASVIASRVVSSEPMSEEDVKTNTEKFTEALDLFIKKKKNIEVTLEDLKKLRFNKEILAEGYMKYIDKKRKDRVEVISVICGMINKQYITPEDNRAALVEVMDFDPDLLIDVPTIYEFFADYLGKY
jgi:translation initiation factor 4G